MHGQRRSGNETASSSRAWLTAGTSDFPTSSDSPQQAASVPLLFCLEDLPNVAVELIAQYASTPTTPAACLLPLVCRGWRAAAERVPLLADITLDLAPACQKFFDRRVISITGRCIPPHWAYGDLAAAEAVLRRGSQLARWLLRHRGSVRSLSFLGSKGPLYKRGIKLGPGAVHFLNGIRGNLVGPQRRATPGTVLPHLVQLELPVLGLRGTSAFLQALARCPSLQRLTLKQASTPAGQAAEPATMQLLASTVSPLTQLRQLCIEWASKYSYVEGSSLAGLLRALPPSVVDMQLHKVGCEDSIPLSCMTHLVNLRAWDDPEVNMVELDSSSSSSSSSNSSHRSCAASALTALTRLRSRQHLSGRDARLQLPNLRHLLLREADPEGWEQLRAMKELRPLTVGVWCEINTDANSVGLDGMTQLQELWLIKWDPFIDVQPPLSQPWAAAVAKLTRLSVLRLPAHVLLVGGSDLLTPLTQLRELTVDCCANQQHHPEDAQGWAATPPGAVVEAVAAAVRGGWAPLQRLVLVVWSFGWVDYRLQFRRAARSALPGLKELVVQMTRL